MKQDQDQDDTQCWTSIVDFRKNVRVTIVHRFLLKHLPCQSQNAMSPHMFPTAQSAIKFAILFEIRLNLWARSVFLCCQRNRMSWAGDQPQILTLNFFSKRRTSYKNCRPNEVITSPHWITPSICQTTQVLHAQRPNFPDDFHRSVWSNFMTNPRRPLTIDNWWLPQNWPHNKCHNKIQSLKQVDKI
jgi:hypothetical protein